MATRYEAKVVEQNKPSLRHNEKLSRGSASVSFQPKLSFYSVSGSGSEYHNDGEDNDDDQETEESAGERFHWWRWLIEDRKAKQGFRVLALANLILLMLSIPFFPDDSSEGSQEDVMRNRNARIQYIVIASLDAILAVLYTFQLIAKTLYVLACTQSQGENKSDLYTDCIRLFTLLGLSLSIWYSVGIGVYRSIEIDIFWAWYIGFLPRAILSVTSAVKLFIPSRIESSLMQTVSTVLKWKQLGKVTVFYFIFVMLFALLGVHIIGGLDNICMYMNGTPAIPITHCNPDTTAGQRHCPQSPLPVNFSEGGGGGEEYQLICGRFPNISTDDIFINYRTFVYYGQFRTVLDGLYAVYEATTLELWSFMMVTGFQGRHYVAVATFYTFLVLFVVIILQQSIFLVVIIESFADLRSQESDTSSNQKTQLLTKPTTVLSLQSGSETKLRLKSKGERSSKDFLSLYGKTLRRMETVFLALVLLDALVTGLKRADIRPDARPYWQLGLQIWQFTVSVLFQLEVIILFLFHLYHGQWKLFFKRPYYMCLCVLATGGIVAAVPHRYFYDPLFPANALVLFQALRFPRLIRISKFLQEFFLKLLGNFRIPILITITVAIIGFLAIVNSQIFAYKVSKCPEQDVTHYSTFPNAFSSTFQLVMNEAWTDITSELMCRTGYEWLVTNLYFIIIHLFSSLIFLNYFGAVILDNLEYDEAEKRNKLEEIKRKEASADTVPLHLRIFKKLNNQPKRLRPPGYGLPDLNLEEVEVRRFFESASVPLSSENLGCQDYVTPPIITPEQTTPESEPPSGAQLRQLSLVSTDNEELIPSSTTPALQRKYQNITAILKFVKLWRQYAEENSTNNTRSTHLPYLFSDNSSYKTTNTKMTRSEFDEFRENHRFFDQALFCMPPEHKLRRFCTFLLTAQAETPKSVKQSSGKLLGLAKSRLSFGVKWVVSQLPYYTWIMFICLWITISVQFGEQIISNRTDDKPDYSYLIVTEVFYVVYMLLWLLVRVLSKGLFLNPHAAINSIWDVLDWIFVIDGFLLLILLPWWHCDSTNNETCTISSNGVVYFSSYSSLPVWVQVMMAIRSLRPLHLVSLFWSLRSLIREILEGYKNLIAGTIIMIGFMFMFASLGVQLFAGSEENPLSFCNDPSIKTEGECVGEFYINIKISREFLNVPETVGTDFMLVPRVWFPYARDFPFNNVLSSMVTLFELLTLEGWTEVRELFSEKGNELANINMKIYVHVYVFLAVNFGLQLFLGIVVNNFNEHKPDHRFLLSVDQNRWVELMQRLSLQRPYKIPQEPRQNIFRLKLYNILTHNHYRFVPTIITILSALTLAVPWDDNASEAIKALVILNVIFNLYTIIEVIAKLFAFGPTFFNSWRNIFDMLMAIITFFYIMTIIIYFITALTCCGILRPLSYFAVGIVFCKTLMVLVKYSAMLNLLVTVGTTILRSIPLIQVLLIIIVCYALLGVILFGDLRRGETLEYGFLNYAGTGQAITLLSRSLTGEDWYQIMWDVGLQEPYGLVDMNSIGSLLLSVTYFVSFIVIVPFILLNVFIAFLLENFSIFYNDDDTNLSLSIIKDFKRKWRHFDNEVVHKAFKSSKGYIKISQLKLLLRTLELQNFYSYTLGEPERPFGRVIRNLTDDPLLLWEMEEELLREVTLPGNKATPSHQGQHYANVSFLTVLKMLAYRCEDINIRLESHDLYAREELETTIQIDVAETCILRWMKKFVKPIVDWDRNQISTTAAATSVTVTQPSKETSVQNRQYQLFSLHNMQSQYVGSNWGKSPSIDTEDEEGQMDSQRLSRLFPAAATNSTTDAMDSEQVDKENVDHEEDAILARTYAKMMQNRSKEMDEAREKAKEWLQMQQEWTNQIGTDPNYFDDGL